jgi:hypothetical protein
MIDIETLSDLELDELQARYEKIRAKCVERQLATKPYKRHLPDIFLSA